MAKSDHGNPPEIGGFSKISGAFWGGPYNKDNNILGSILGSPYLGKLPNSFQVLNTCTSWTAACCHDELKAREIQGREKFSVAAEMISPCTVGSQVKSSEHSSHGFCQKSNHPGHPSDMLKQTDIYWGDRDNSTSRDP